MRADDAFPTFLVWDNDGEPPKGEWIQVLWRGYGQGGDAAGYSIPRFVEEHADTLRARFLAWLHELGETQLDGRRFLDCLTLRPGLSYWWMTLLVEKNYCKSRCLSEAVKLLALEEMLGANHACKIILASADKNLASAFRHWCSNASWDFDWRRLSPQPSQDSVRGKVYRWLPRPIQALLTLRRYFRCRGSFRQIDSGLLAKSTAETTFCSYLFNLDNVSAQAGRFLSYYWTDLHELLEQEATAVNWLHHFIDHESIPTAQAAQALVTHFNQNRETLQRHAIIDGALSWSVIWRVLRDFCRIAMMGLRVRKIRCHFRPAGTKLDFWPLFKLDFHESMFGSAAIWNCLFLNLFEKILKMLPRQRLGVYLQEGMGWEIAFIHAWKAAGHGKLVGVAHATVRFWDLRYFFDPRTYRRSGINDFPLPDVVALNGPAALSAFRVAGYPVSRMIEVEALRYLYLNDFSSQIAENGNNSDSLRILVLGDISPAITRKQMQWLETAAPSLPANSRFVVKPHPACSIREEDYPGLKLRITERPLGELLGDCDVAYTSYMTSAAVDAYCFGVPVVSVLDGDAFNISPLRGRPGVIYATNPDELSSAVLHAWGSKEVNARETYFCLDKQLPRWRSLLSSSADCNTI
ncbi:MAG: hypothetical protein KKH22_10525 [Proteobacteria bacterium]|nr:hypothetical protein [Pseudomonadota bacterium]